MAKVLLAGKENAVAALLRFKETCQIQAESYSAAEVQHGPMVKVAW